MWPFFLGAKMLLHTIKLFIQTFTSHEKIELGVLYTICLVTNFFKFSHETISPFLQDLVLASTVTYTIVKTVLAILAYRKSNKKK